MKKITIVCVVVLLTSCAAVKKPELDPEKVQGAFQAVGQSFQVIAKLNNELDNRVKAIEKKLGIATPTPAPTATPALQVAKP